MTFLALDQSKSRTGWAAWAPGWERPRYGSVQIGSEYTSDRQAFTKLRTTIIDLYSTVTQFEFLIYEEPIAHKQGVTTSEANILTLVGLRAIIEGVGYELRCRSVDMVSEKDWRPPFIGRVENAQAKAEARMLKKQGDKRASARNTLKAMTMERCRLYGFVVRHDDEGDAIGLLTYGILSKGMTPPWIANETLRAPLGVRA